VSDLPRGAQIFVATVWVLGVVAAAMTRLSSGLGADAWELGLFVLLGALAGRTKVRLISRRVAEDKGLLSLGFALIFAALLRLGPAAAMLVGAVSTLCSCAFPRRQPLHQMAFNIALNAVATYSAGAVFLQVNRGTLQLDRLGSFPAVTLSCLTFFLISTGAVAVVIALCTRQAVPRLWLTTFLGTGPSYFASAGAGTLAIVILSPHVGVILLFVTPVAYLAYLSCAVYARNTEEKQQHIAELQVNQSQLSSALEQEHRIAEALQRSLLMRAEDKAFPGLEVATVYEPALDEALLGGDFYDIFRLPGDKTALVVGDVSGKGLAAAVQTAEVKFVLRGYLREHSDPAEALAELNRYICQARELDGGDDFGGFIALSVLVVDTGTGDVVAASAGAEPPLALRATGEVALLDTAGMPIGVDGESRYEATALHLHERDTLLVVTDGFTEARRDRDTFLGQDGLLDILKQVADVGSARQAGEAILEKTRAFAGGKLQDDACLLLVRRA
jgi:serine phosphatase RsbU (regulator of sigma subunit)